MMPFLPCASIQKSYVCLLKSRRAVRRNTEFLIGLSVAWRNWSGRVRRRRILSRMADRFCPTASRRFTPIRYPNGPPKNQPRFLLA